MSRSRVGTATGIARAPAIGGSYARQIATACEHLGTVEHTRLPAEIAGCEECLAQGMTWVHLRMCQECGHIGCCDNSEGKHATAHFEATGHPIIRSAEPGEDWSWCYLDEIAFRLEGG